jgi:uncharacterized protein
MAFFEAIKEGNIDKLRSLLLENPNLLEEKDSRGFPPLIMATYANQKEATNFLIAQGANLDNTDSAGNTALMGLCFKGHLDLAKLLIDSKADLNIQNKTGATALI